MNWLTSGTYFLERGMSLEQDQSKNCDKEDSTNDQSSIDGCSDEENNSLEVTLRDIGNRVGYNCGHVNWKKGISTDYIDDWIRKMRGRDERQRFERFWWEDWLAVLGKWMKTVDKRWWPGDTRHPLPCNSDARKGSDCDWTLFTFTFSSLITGLGEFVIGSRMSASRLDMGLPCLARELNVDWGIELILRHFRN